eukprot:TRINITY_DN7335_c0_g1_i1.p1 TRINITY_DN7335_c0_g1~~TRINITY_DN7335_c0_g1_i1.p1  ORF type:complete len:222 (-),score=11.35 TRINITY_DN7335_c0_g1_i1:472-1137(-)
MVAHPYYPRSIALDGFSSQLWSMPAILGVFAIAVFVVVGGTLLLSSGNKRLTALDRATLAWWIATGLIHSVIEGSYAIAPTFYQTTSANFLHDLWKEYSKGDSRYATRDSFVVSMETVTAFAWGPGSFLVAYALATDAPYRHAAQLLVSLGQLYGDVLYFGTCYLEGFVHSDPGWLYFYGYFVFMNAIWIVVPSLLIGQSWRAISTAFASLKPAKARPKRL